MTEEIIYMVHKAELLSFLLGILISGYPLFMFGKILGMRHAQKIVKDMVNQHIDAIIEEYESNRNGSCDQKN